MSCTFCTITKELQKSNRIVTKDYRLVTMFCAFYTITKELQNGYNLVTKSYKAVTARG